MTARDRPWLARADWRDGVIHWRGDGRKARRLVVITAIFLAVVAYNAASDFSLPFFLAISGVFIFVIKQAGDQWRRERAFGLSTFTFDQVPFLLGGRLKGMIHTNVAGIGEETRLMLTCFHGSYDEETGPQWRVVRVILQDHMHRDRDKVTIDVDFNIPEDQPPTTLKTFVWELSVLRGFPTGRRMVIFEVPVFPRDAEEFVQETGVARGAKSEVRKALSVFDE